MLVSGQEFLLASADGGRRTGVRTLQQDHRVRSVLVQLEPDALVGTGFQQGGTCSGDQGYIFSFHTKPIIFQSPIDGMATAR